MVGITKRGKKVVKQKDVKLFYRNYNHFVKGQLKNNFDYSKLHIATIYDEFY